MLVPGQTVARWVHCNQVLCRAVMIWAQFLYNISPQRAALLVACMPHCIQVEAAMSDRPHSKSPLQTVAKQCRSPLSSNCTTLL